MLWDPSFVTWRTLGVQANSQMLLMTSDLSQRSNLIYGFDDNQRAALLDLVATL